MKINKNDKLPIIIFGFIFILGICFIVYPFVSNFVNEKKYKKIINKYDVTVNGSDNNFIDVMFKDASDYNKNLNNNSIRDVFSKDKVVADSLYSNLLNVMNDGVMGYISIPKLELKLPIYHGTDESVLSKGVGHLIGSSLPIGGIGTHSILAAHRGLPSSKLFTDLDKLKKGDVFYVTILHKNLFYEVDNVAVVEPNDLSLLDINAKEDYITLVTCTPYAVNSHRLLVRGRRVTKELNIEEKGNITFSVDEVISIVLICIIMITLTIQIIKFLRKNQEVN